MAFDTLTPMKNNLRFYTYIVAAIALFFALGVHTSAFAAPVTDISQNHKYASIVIEAHSGRVLSHKNATQKFHPASMTKMMTLYMTFDALTQGKLNIDEPLSVSRTASRMPASKLYLQPGDTITVHQAILALVTKSANDVAVVLAEKLGRTEKAFAGKMTRKARALGMKDTVFMNASGLHHTKQVSTARDMALLARTLMVSFPQYYRYFQAQEFKFKGKTFTSHNNFMKNYPGADGLKTGYIRASGFNLAASAIRNNVRLIGIVFGGESSGWRDDHMSNLMDGGFRTAYAIINKNRSRNVRRAAIASRRAQLPKAEPIVLASVIQNQQQEQQEIQKKAANIPATADGGIDKGDRLGLKAMISQAAGLETSSKQSSIPTPITKPISISAYAAKVQ